MLTHDRMIRAMFDMALEFLYDSQLNDALDMVQRRILDVRGRNDGRVAASWYFDGNTETMAYERVLKGIEDGDPEILDTFPNPRLSGEFADEPTWEDIVLEELGVNIREDDTLEGDEWINSYNAGFDSAVHETIERNCREMLGLRVGL